MNLPLLRFSTIVRQSAILVALCLPSSGYAQLRQRCLPSLESFTTSHPVPSRPDPSRPVSLAITGDKPTSTLDLSSASASLTPRIKKQMSEIGSYDLIVISDNTLLNKPLIGEIKKAKTPLIFTLGDNSVASRAKAQNMLMRKFESISTVAVLPQDAASISRVWNKKITSKTALTQMKRAKAQFNRIHNAKVISGTEAVSFKAQILHEIASGSENELFILVGHNENGFIKGPDGTQLALQEFTQALSRHKRQGLLLSCETMSTGPVFGPAMLTTNRLLPEQVAMALHATQASLISYSHPTFSDFFVEYGKAVNAGAPAGQQHTKVIAVVVGAAILVTAAVIASDDDDSSSHN